MTFPNITAERVFTTVQDIALTTTQESTAFYLKDVAHGGGVTENYHLTLSSTEHFSIFFLVFCLCSLLQLLVSSHSRKLFLFLLSRYFLTVVHSYLMCILLMVLHNHAYSFQG